MCKVNTRGIIKANKGMLMDAMAYNLKKYLKYTKKQVETITQGAEKHLAVLFAEIRLILSS
jgi:hypothetical protein